MRAKEKTKVKRDESKQDKTVRQTKKGKITRAHICHKYHKILENFGRFCYNLRAFMWRKIEPKKYICGEKMTNMRSGEKYVRYTLKI